MRSHSVPPGQSPIHWPKSERRSSLQSHTVARMLHSILIRLVQLPKHSDPEKCNALPASMGSLVSNISILRATASVKECTKNLLVRVRVWGAA